jgi:hypothetical protein
MLLSEENIEVHKDEIVKLSFEYALANIFEYYVAYEGVGDKITFFNAYNNFSTWKLKIYPFFVSTSNGHSKMLFKIFGEFKSLQIGPISKPVEINICQNDSCYFDYKGRITIRERDYVTTIKQLRDEIKKHKITINNSEHKFEDLKIHNDKNSPNNLFLAIENGIKVLEEQSVGRFFSYQEKDLLDIASKYKAYEIVQKDQVLNYGEISKQKKEMKLPFYSNDCIECV